MDKLQRLSPSLANVSADFTPKRNCLSQRPMTPLHVIKEENDEKQRNKSTPIRRNPFDVKAETLYFPSCSPSVFATFQRNKVDNGTFRWSIEHLSVLYPADIDETSVPDTWVDAEQEVKAQKAIDTFFSQNSIVPSPWSSSPKEGRGEKSKRRACISSMFQDVQSSDAGTQTMLSIPPNVDLSKILGNFFTYDDTNDAKSHDISRENSREESDLLSTSSLRRKLFPNDDECASPSRIESKSLYSVQRWSTPTVHMRTVQSTPASDVLSSSPITPPNCSDSCNILSSPPVSPIASTHLNASYTDLLPTSNHPPHSPTLPSDSAMSFCVDSQDTVAFPSSYGSERPNIYSSGQQDTSLSQNMTSSMINYGLTSRIDSQDTVPFLSSYGSERQDTGYITGSSQNTTSSMINCGFASRIDSQDTVPFLSSYGSERQDTGYTTGSSQNMTSSIINYGLTSRITPVTELMEECELSSASVSCDMSFRNEAIERKECKLSSTCDMSFRNVEKCTRRLFENEERAFGDVSALDVGKPPSFKTYPWVPTCSTPTKCNHL